MDDEIAALLNERQRTIWSTGDWPAFAPLVQDVATEVVERIGTGPGQDFLDVATGSGNAAFAAAEAGAAVTGVDIVPGLVAAARKRFAEAGLEGEFVVGNAEDLPFADANFDRVVSIFGAMFAPRQERTAAELVRVTRPGGTIAVAAWTPEGVNGRLLAMLAGFMPPPPPGFVPPLMWGVEDHVRELFAATGANVSCERLMAQFAFDSADGWIDYCERNLGPIIVAKAMLEGEGRWAEARAALTGLERESNQADDGTFRSEGEYLLSIATKPA